MLNIIRPNRQPDLILPDTPDHWPISVWIGENIAAIHLEEDASDEGKLIEVNGVKVNLDNVAYPSCLAFIEKLAAEDTEKYGRRAEQIQVAREYLLDLEIEKMLTSTDSNNT